MRPTDTLFRAYFEGGSKQKFPVGFIFRYAEQTSHQAIVQKLARMISGLHAVETLKACC